MELKAKTGLVTLYIAEVELILGQSGSGLQPLTHDSVRRWLLSLPDNLWALVYKNPSCNH